MRSAAAAANGAKVQVNTHSAAKKYKAPTALVPETARSVAAAPKISSGVASGNTINDSSTLPRRRPPAQGKLLQSAVIGVAFEQEIQRQERRQQRRHPKHTRCDVSQQRQLQAQSQRK